ncbi:hypothetical protein LWI28_000659 [Acer negundo]|uniref:CCHC-type domain-containing protein n=1 Tax=Acer negundo TaxID=4023 RepID=A0AAD5NHF3_ACENE|nr:hypothetical protein LWI28_000659 [Acer negundo]
MQPLPERIDKDFVEVKVARKKREGNESKCHGHILNALSDRLYDLYTNMKSAKEIWNALHCKYKAEEKVNNLRAVKIELPEPFQVGVIIAKLPPSWKCYRKMILHKSEDYSLEEIQKNLRIEEESHSRDKIVEEFNTGKANADQGKFKNNKKGACFVCGKYGHYARDYGFRKKQNEEANVNATEEEIIAVMSEICVVQ